MADDDMVSPWCDQGMSGTLDWAPWLSEAEVVAWLSDLDSAATTPTTTMGDWTLWLTCVYALGLAILVGWYTMGLSPGSVT